MSALRKVIRHGLLCERGAASSQRDTAIVIVCKDDFEAAFKKVKPSVSKRVGQNVN